MVDSNSQADSAAEPFPLSANSSDLDQRLGLYRVFLKLYEHHRELLDEILDLENSDRYRVRGVWLYVQATVEAERVFLTTNLLQGKTQQLFQSQHCWVIGRDRKAGLPVQDKRLSRRHAMIQYIAGQGFYLVDLSSTNGSYVNGELVRRPVLLKDGDRIRLGSLSFLFFLGVGSRILAEVPTNVIPHSTEDSSPPSLTDSTEPPLNEELLASDLNEPLDSNDKETFLFTKPIVRPEVETLGSGTPDLSTSEKSDILDRFLNR